MILTITITTLILLFAWVMWQTRKMPEKVCKDCTHPCLGCNK